MKLWQEVSMRRALSFSIAFVLVLMAVSTGKGEEPTEVFFQDLPAGLFLKNSVEVPPDRVKAISQEMGGRDISRITNSVVQVYGRPIQINVITVMDESDAQIIYEELSKHKKHPFSWRKGQFVIEFTGKNIDKALAIVTANELGFLEKPKCISYRVITNLVPVKEVDYMALNSLSNLISSDDSLNQNKIKELLEKFTFCNKLNLRSVESGGKTPIYKFDPVAISEKETGVSTIYTFDQFPKRYDVPYVTTTMEITVDDTGFLTEKRTPSKALTAATPFWPSDDPEVLSLAREITKGLTTNDAKVQAILEWLAPGVNMRASGPRGSRWGTKKFLEQKIGHCWDFSDCFVTLARASGIPSRQVAGWTYVGGGHVWAEFYREGKGWQQVDPTGGGKIKCGIYDIPYFTSEDGEMPILYASMLNIEIIGQSEKK